MTTAKSEVTWRARMMDASRSCRGSGLRIQERGGFLQIRSVQPLGEVGKNLSDAGTCLAVTAARLWEAREAERCPQLEAAGALCARDLQSPVEVLLGRRRAGRSPAAQGQLAAKPVQFRFVQTLAGFSRQREALVHDPLALRVLPGLGKCLGEQSEVIRLIGEAAGGSPVAQGLAEPGDAVDLFAGVGAGPAAEDRAAGEPEREAVFGGNRGTGLRANAGAAAIPAKLMKHGGEVERQRLAAGRERVAQAHGLAAEPPRFIGIAEQP